MLKRGAFMDFLTFPTPEDIRKAISSGQLEKAEKLIKERLENRVCREIKNMNQKLHFELYRIQLLKRAYKLKEKEAYKKLKRRIEGLTKEEFVAMARDGVLDSMNIDGEKFYETRFDSNLFFNYPAYKKRQKETREDKLAKKRRELINKSIDRLLKGERPKAYKVRLRINLKCESPINEKVNVWLPFPKEGFQQWDVKLINASHEPIIAPNNVGQRTVFMQGLDTDEFFVEFSYKVHEWIGHQKLYQSAGTENLAQEDLSEKPPHILFTKYLYNLIDIIFHGEDFKKYKDIERARKIYDFITLNVHYSYVLPYALYDNISEYVATVFKGDCGFQAILFITLCRMVGVPTKWQSGLSVTPFSASPHDWALVFLQDYGWVPVDLSFGGGRRDNEKHRLFYFTNLDSFRMFANTEFQSEFQPSKIAWRSDPYDNQLGEMELISKQEDGYVLDTLSEIKVLEFKNIKNNR